MDLKLTTRNPSRKQLTEHQHPLTRINQPQTRKKNPHETKQQQHPPRAEKAPNPLLPLPHTIRRRNHQKRNNTVVARRQATSMKAEQETTNTPQDTATNSHPPPTDTGKKSNINETTPGRNQEDVERKLKGTGAADALPHCNLTIPQREEISMLGKRRGPGRKCG